MAEIFFIGSIQGASEFPSANLTTKYQVVAGDDWSLVEGVANGQTHVDLPRNGLTTVWSHPIDLHYSTKSLRGWPKIAFEIFSQDEFGRHELFGYSVVNLPVSTGTHEIECHAWRPKGTSLKDALEASLLGIHPQLKSPAHAHEANDRFKLITETMGKIHMSVTVLTRGLKTRQVIA